MLVSIWKNRFKTKVTCLILFIDQLVITTFKPQRAIRTQITIKYPTQRCLET